MEKVDKVDAEQGIITIWTDKDKYFIYLPYPSEGLTPKTKLHFTFPNYHGETAEIHTNHMVDGRSRKTSNYFSGEFHPRICRGDESPAPEEVGYRQQMIDSMLVCRQLIQQLKDIFYFIHPDKNHFGVFGHRQRELLLLACMEVETAWRSVLVENTTNIPDRLNTTHYVNLLQPMRLNEWEVEFVTFPQFGKISPFANWDTTRPTKSLAWYDAYNAVKHDRENELHRATVENVVSAIVGAYLMTISQFGISICANSTLAINDFRITKEPKWKLEEYYTRPIMGVGSLYGQPLGYDVWTKKSLAFVL